MYNRKIPPFWTYMALYVPGNSHEVKTVHRAAERPPTGKLKLSRVTSGYGGLKIPLGRIRLTPKMGVIWVKRKRMEILGSKMDLLWTLGPINGAF